VDPGSAREPVEIAAPRRLRLDELLHELGARAHAAERVEDGRPDGLTVGELVDKAAEAGFGFLIAILALIAIPFFGLSTPFGLAIALVGVLIHPRLVGLGVVILALALALPLPIPGSNLVFLIPIFIYAVGVLERDGVWIIVGHVATLVDIALLFAFGNAVSMVLARVWRWIT